ncbi:MAG TPA: biopolymer transporter ExbD [Chthoniobacteraceae bacterium]|jgi:biopolymer transport protein ExbD|nr:biopolymer transporter ExbD [Chthoniobacteraceae bacterium]
MHRLTAREKAKKELKNPPEEDPEFQIAPMIDILLVLLVFFMSISSTEVLQNNHSIILPVAADGKDASKNNPGQVTVNITWNEINETGSIEINDTKYPDANAIVPHVHDAVVANPVARVLIRADRGVKWSFMKTVMKAVAQAGVENVTFSVVNKAYGPGAK